MAPAFRVTLCTLNEGDGALCVRELYGLQTRCQLENVTKVGGGKVTLAVDDESGGGGGVQTLNPPDVFLVPVKDHTYVRLTLRRPATDEVHAVVSASTLLRKLEDANQSQAQLELSVRPRGSLGVSFRLVNHDTHGEEEEGGRRGGPSGSGCDTVVSIAPVRRGAVKRHRIHEIRGHQFVAKFYHHPTFCGFCHDFIWGLGKQGYQCRSCLCAVHKRCHDKILSVCPKAPTSVESPKLNGERFSVNIPHQLHPHTYKYPTFCYHCGSLLYGIRLQGLRCTSCGINCHRKCHQYLPNYCGVDQKDLAEALGALKKLSISPSVSPNTNSFSNLTISLQSYYNFLKRQCGVDSRRKRRTLDESCLKPVTVSLDDFTLLNVLGSGSFGKVLLAEFKSTGRAFALKCLRKDVVVEDSDTECSQVERSVLEVGASNPFICTLFSTFQSKSHLFFVLEFLNGGDLVYHIQQEGRFDQDRARFYAAQVACGLQFLHSHNIVYRDVKLDNIVLDSDGNARICDMGMCRLNVTPVSKCSTFCGTPDYLAPEVLMGEPYDQAVDWWSFGILLYEMLVGRSPFSGCDENEMFWSICNEHVYFPQIISAQARQILVLLLEKSPQKRLGSASCPGGSLREHVFFKPIAWDELEKKKIPPPVKPVVKGRNDCSYIDDAFLHMQPKLTIIDSSVVDSINPDMFRDFDYISDKGFH